MKQLYQRISTENESLKGLWATKLNLDGQSGLATDEDLAAYESKLKELQTELERRKDLGAQFEAVLHRTMLLRNKNEEDREEHQVGHLWFDVSPGRVISSVSRIQGCLVLALAKSRVTTRRSSWTYSVEIICISQASMYFF